MDRCPEGVRRELASRTTLRRRILPYAAAFAGLKHPLHARVAGCASLIEIRSGITVRGRNRVRCETRYCPSCGRERLAAVSRAHARSLQALLPLRPDLTWLFATVRTTPVAIADAAAEILRQRQVLRRLREGRQWPASGGISVQEVAFLDAELAHAHSHLLLAVPPSSWAESRERVLAALSGRFTSPHVQAVQDGRSWSESGGLQAVSGCAQYMAKPPRFAHHQRASSAVLATCRARLTVALDGIRMPPQKVGSLWRVAQPSARGGDRDGNREVAEGEDVAWEGEAEHAKDDYCRAPQMRRWLFRWASDRQGYRLVACG